MRYVIRNEFRYDGFLYHVQTSDRRPKLRMYREFGSNNFNIMNPLLWKCRMSQKNGKYLIEFLWTFTTISGFFFWSHWLFFSLWIFWEEGVKMGKKKKRFHHLLKKCTTTNVPDVSMPYDTLAGALNRLTSISLMQLDAL